MSCFWGPLALPLPQAWNLTLLREPGLLDQTMVVKAKAWKPYAFWDLTDSLSPGCVPGSGRALGTQNRQGLDMRSDHSGNSRAWAGMLLALERP